MALRLIVGPPNSGRAGEVRRRFAELIARDPVLVVPTRDDAERFERELCESADAVVGGSVRTFPWLFEDFARAAGAVRARRLTAAQRLALVRSAVREADPGILRASAPPPRGGGGRGGGGGGGVGVRARGFLGGRGGVRSAGGGGDPPLSRRHGHRD